MHGCRFSLAVQRSTLVTQQDAVFDMKQEDSIREVRDRYQQLGWTLNELQRRHWAAREALQLGHGGIAIVSKALRIAPNTIKRGIQEISAGQADLLLRATTRVRKPGGGRKSKPSSESDATLAASEMVPPDDVSNVPVDPDCGGDRPASIPIAPDHHSGPSVDQ